MKRILLLVGAWAAATLAAAVVAWGAVGIVGDQVTDAVDIPLSAAEVEQIVAARAASAAVPVTTSAAPTSSITPSMTTSSLDTAPTTAQTAPDGTATTSTTTIVAAPASTTTQPPTATTSAERTRAVSVAGGTIVVRWSASGGARLTSATPDQGWYVEVEKAGPPSVEVKFESTGDNETEVHIEVSDGELRIDVGEG